MRGSLEGALRSGWTAIRRRNVVTWRGTGLAMPRASIDGTAQRTNRIDGGNIPMATLSAWILGSLSLFSIVSVAAKRPWTIAIAKQHNPPEVWSTPLFLETNMLITGMWAALFAVGAILATAAGWWVNLAYAALLVFLGRRSPSLGAWYSTRRLRAMGLAA
jgi:hypothetical protein